MFTLVYLLGWLGTVALVVSLWTQRRSGSPGLSRVLAALIGLAVGLFWPITLWMVGGVWWRRRATRAAAGSAGPVRLPSLGGIVAVCAVGSVLTVAALSGAAPPPSASSTPSSLASAAMPATATSASLPVPAPAALRVVGVVDGDTVDLSDGRRVRLLGIDAPERGECGYQEATDFARTSLLDRQVQVNSDPTQAETDQYGRALLYVGAPNDYSIAAAEAGWAERYIFNRKPVQKAPLIEAAQQSAQAQRLGIWGILCVPVPTSAPATSQQAPPAAGSGDEDRDPAAAAPKPQPRPEPQPEPKPEPEADDSNCHPSYLPCVPNGPDLDCGEIGHAVRVVGPDEYRLDGDDNDGQGCESYG